MGSLMTEDHPANVLKLGYGKYPGLPGILYRPRL
jgi:hypothetical protein